ncbi:hypothetical protein OH76DRAFT_1556700 [Lentinus brumalis]|uniref:BTB domain-containing protein n=1 Tax=Lentinus brumalis TaxID=2498619 RepID=A0A371D8Y0_9APHY|nr:hypothetical protein OH76DRAFT_1556700 [Polyporus brumalis]
MTVLQDAHPRKRQRHDKSNGAEQGVEIVERIRDEEFWFEDGSIILAARDVEFRVYKGLLANHSPVFKDMFSLPQPPTSEGALESPCPVVHLADSPEDVRCLLRVCMPDTSTNPFAHEDPTYESVASAIRLGHKYQIAPLVEHALGYLKKYYTTTWKPLKSWAPPRFRPVHAIGVVNLARLVGCDTLLPTAFIDCCQLEGALVGGPLNADGTTEHLSASDLALCFSASINLARECVGMEMYMRRPAVSPSCRYPTQCTRTFEKKHGPDVDVAKLCRPNPFYSLHLGYLGNHGAVCVSCASMLSQRDDDEGKKLWKRLPSVIGLSIEGWPGS